jgi:hypothetical protein
VIVGVVFRILVFSQALVGDELSTLWIVTNNGIGSTISFVATDAEITPPLYFVLARISTLLGSSVDLIRLPALMAGIGLIPLIYLLARMIIGRRAALIASAVASVSPLLIYFSANARAYSLMILLVAGSTMFLLLAARDGRNRWWAAYAVCVCLSMYTHYTVAFVLTGQFIWAFWALPGARKPLLVSTAGAAVMFLPWLPSLLADLNSPTTEVLKGLEPDTLSERWIAFQQVLFLRTGTGAIDLFGRPDVLVTLSGCLLAISVLASRAVRRLPTRFIDDGLEHGVSLVLVLTFSAPVFSIVLGLFGTDLSGIRELAGTWVGLPLLLGMVLAASGRYWGLAATALVLAGLTICSVHLADADKSGFPYPEAADWIDQNAGPNDAILDDSSISPSPATPLDAYLPPGRPEYRLRVPEDDPGYIDSLFDPPEAEGLIKGAFAGDRKVFLVKLGEPVTPGANGVISGEGSSVTIPAGWEETGQKTFEGLVPLTVTEFSRDPAEAVP